MKTIVLFIFSVLTISAFASPQNMAVMTGTNAQTIQGQKAFTGDALFSDPTNPSDCLYIATTWTNSDHGLYIALSTTGSDWNFTSASHIYVDPSGGACRDMSINYFGGCYWLAYGKDDNESDGKVYFAKSYDLTNWTYVGSADTSSGLPGVHDCWAGQWFQEPGVADYTGAHIFVNMSTSSSNITSDMQTYELHPLDSNLSTWSTPVKLSGSLPGNILDACCTEVSGTFNLFYRHATYGAGDYIEHATATSITGPYTPVHTGDWMGIGTLKEGPTIVPIDNGKYRLYYDNFGVPKVQYVDFTDGTFSSNSAATDIGTPIPWRHCDVVRTTGVRQMRQALTAFITTPSKIWKQKLAVGAYSTSQATDSAAQMEIMANLPTFSLRGTGPRRFWVDEDLTNNDFYFSRKGVAGYDIFKLSGGTNDLEFFGLNAFDIGVKVGTAGTTVTRWRHGTATLTGGTVVVSNTSVTANTRIILTAQDNNSTGALRVSSRSSGASFTITSSNSGDNGSVAYSMIEP